jgi:hypothetical protein
VQSISEDIITRLTTRGCEALVRAPSILWALRSLLAKHTKKSATLTPFEKPPVEGRQSDTLSRHHTELLVGRGSRLLLRLHRFGLALARAEGAEGADALLPQQPPPSSSCPETRLSALLAGDEEASVAPLSVSRSSTCLSSSLSAARKRSPVTNAEPWRIEAGSAERHGATCG